MYCPEGSVHHVDYLAFNAFKVLQHEQNAGLSCNIGRAAACIASWCIWKLPYGVIEAALWITSQMHDSTKLQSCKARQVSGSEKKGAL